MFRILRFKLFCSSSSAFSFHLFFSPELNRGLWREGLEIWSKNKHPGIGPSFGFLTLSWKAIISLLLTQAVLSLQNKIPSLQEPLLYRLLNCNYTLPAKRHSLAIRDLPILGSVSNFIFILRPFKKFSCQ